MQKSQGMLNGVVLVNCNFIVTTNFIVIMMILTVHWDTDDNYDDDNDDFP